MVDEVVKTIHYSKEKANPYEFSKYSHEIIKEFLDNRHSFVKDKKVGKLNILIDKATKFKYYFRKSRLSRYPFVYTKLVFHPFSSPHSPGAVLTTANMLKFNSFTLLVSQIWEHRLNLLSQLIRRWHGRVSVRYKSTPLGGKITLEIYTLKVKSKYNSYKKAGFFKVFTDVMGKLNMVKNKVTDLEFDHALKKVYRELKMGKWVRKRAHSDFHNLIRTGQLSREKIMAYLHYDHKKDSLEKELFKSEHKKSILKYFSLEGDIASSDVTELITQLKKQFLL